MMRIATSTIYSNQTLSIENLESQYQQQGQELSTGIALNEPSDNPTVIAQDLEVRNDSAVTTQIGQNLTGLNNVLSTTDSTLSSLTSILQSARNLAIEGATDTITTTQRQSIGQQVNQLLQEAIGLANTQYGGKFIFSGTAASPGSSLVTAVGNPPSAVTAENNIVQQTEELPNGQHVPTNVTLQQAFNLNASNGSPSVFQMLIRLRDTMDQGQTTDESSSQVNLNYMAVTTGTLVSTLENSGRTRRCRSRWPRPARATWRLRSPRRSRPRARRSPSRRPRRCCKWSMRSTLASTATGVVASFNYQTQRLSLNDVQNQNFLVSNVAAAPGIATSNFTNAFLLGSTGDVVNNLSTQLGDIDNTLSVALGCRRPDRRDGSNGKLAHRNRIFTRNERYPSAIGPGRYRYC